MKITFYADELRHVRHYDDESSFRNATDFEFEFDGVPAVDTSELNKALCAYRDSLAQKMPVGEIYKRRTASELQYHKTYTTIAGAMK